MTDSRRRLPRAALVALLAAPLVIAAAPGHAQEGASPDEPEQSETAGEGPGVDLPLVGRVPLPGFMAGWFGGDEEAAGEEGGGEPSVPAVIVARVETRSVGETINFIGTIRPIEQVGVRARVEGYIREVAFTGGQKVRAGDLLFQIEPDQYEARVQAAEAQISGAQATLNQAQRDFDRQQELVSSGVTARATLDTATANLETARANMLQAEASLTQARLDLGYTRITAAIDGEMSAPIITRGNYVSATSGDLATLTQMDPIWGVFPIGENQLSTWQRVGVTEAQSDPEIAGSGSAAPSPAEGGESETAQGDGEGTQVADASGGAVPAAGQGEASDAAPPVPSAEGTGAAGAPPPPPGSDVTADALARADAEVGRDFVLQLRLPNGAMYEPPGRFDFVSNTVSSTTGTVEARISFPNGGDFLLANQNVTLIANERRPPVLPVVPQSSIQFSREGRFVLLVRPDDTVERRQIEVGQQIGNMTAVRAGLSGGETLVVRGGANVEEGARVAPSTEEEARAREGSNAPAAPAGGGEQAGGTGADSQPR